MSMFMQTNCMWAGCHHSAGSLADLIMHQEDNHIDFDPRVVEQKEMSRPSSIPLSYVSRFFTDATRREYMEEKRRRENIEKKQQIQSQLSANQQIQSQLLGNQPKQSQLSANQKIQSQFSANQKIQSQHLANQQIQSQLSANQKIHSQFLANQKIQSQFLSNQQIQSQFSANLPSLRSSTPSDSDFDDRMTSSEEESDDRRTLAGEYSPEYVTQVKGRYAPDTAPGAPGPSARDKPYACPIPGCNKRYKNLNGIKYHSVNGHKKDVRAREGFKCVCGRSYKTSKTFKTHQERCSHFKSHLPTPKSSRSRVATFKNPVPYSQPLAPESWSAPISHNRNPHSRPSKRTTLSPFVTSRNTLSPPADVLHRNTFRLTTGHIPAFVIRKPNSGNNLNQNRQVKTESTERIPAFVIPKRNIGTIMKKNRVYKCIVDINASLE